MPFEKKQQLHGGFAGAGKFFQQITLGRGGFAFRPGFLFWGCNSAHTVAATLVLPLSTK